jgi:hypothetical protein
MLRLLNVPPLLTVQNADFVFERCFVPDSARLPGVDSFKDTNKVLAISRQVGCCKLPMPWALEAALQSAAV